jgi:hypothetical protein
MVSQGAKMILTTSDDFAPIPIVVAAKYPDIPFVHISGGPCQDRQGPLRRGQLYEQDGNIMKAVAGCAAALKTESGQVALSLVTLVNDVTRRLALPTYQGCQSVLLTKSFAAKDPAKSEIHRHLDRLLVQLSRASHSTPTRGRQRHVQTKGLM